MCSCTYVRGGEWCGRVRETTYLLSEHTKPYVKAQLVGLLLGTCRHLESYHKVLLEGGENYLEEELHKNKSLGGWLWSQGRAV